MFKIASKPTFKWPIKFKVIDDNGRYSTVSFTGEFKRLSQTEVNELLDKLRDEAADFNDVKLCKDILVGFTDVKDEDNNDLTFDETALEMVLDVPGAASNIAKTFFEALSGAREKN